jgi:hypothetical protein
MNPTNYLTAAQYKADKRRLTAALNRGDANDVIYVVTATFAEWDAGDFAYPDDWHRWERALRDAEMTVAGANW